VKRLSVFLLLSASGCAGFVSPTPEALRRLGIEAGSVRRDPVRYRVQVSFTESPWIMGEVEGVIVVQHGDALVVRAQFFADVGGKAIDLLARPDRIVGWFPHLKEGVDCALPGEAAPHPLLFLGLTLLECFSDVTKDRIEGILEDDSGCWIQLKPVVAGTRVSVYHDWKEGVVVRHRFRWMHGIAWEEEAHRITAPGVDLRVRLLGSEPAAPISFELALPVDVRVVAGARK
jgi:hypothetical protein